VEKLSASSFLEVLERQAKSGETPPSKDEANCLFEIKDPNSLTEVIQQIKQISVN